MGIYVSAHVALLIGWCPLLHMVVIIKTRVFLFHVLSLANWEQTVIKTVVV